MVHRMACEERHDRILDAVHKLPSVGAEIEGAESTVRGESGRAD